MTEASQKSEKTSSQEYLINAVQNLQRAIRSAQEKSQNWIAWQQLNLVDEKGVNHVKPHTQEAIATLEALFALDESDCDIIHHLAIAYHAMAWDIELQEPDSAQEYWEKALYFWRKLLSCGNFWQELINKGSNLGIEFDENKIKQFRQNLLFYILEIHVEFIRHYLEMNRLDQAHRHIELIKRSQIPPAVRNKLEDLIYEAMTSNIPDILAEGRFQDALNILDDFLNFLPLCLPALQSYLEIAKQWLEQLSPSHYWQQILILDLRILSKWNNLKKCGQLFDHPLAQAVLVDLACLLGKKHYAKARSLRLERQEKSKPELISLADDELKAYDRAILWLKNTSDYHLDEVNVDIELYNALMSRAELKALVALNTKETEVTYQLFDQAFTDCEEAMEISQDEMAPRKLAVQILQRKIESKLSNFPSGLGKQDYAVYIKEIEDDLDRAIQLDPDNTSVQDLRKMIREI